MNLLRKPILYSLAGWAILAGCITQKESNRGTVVDNELRVGTLYLADGAPAANARVRIFPVNHVPDTSASPEPAEDYFSTRTDAMGKYKVDILPDGEYNILGESEGAFSYQDSVYLTADTDSIPVDTLFKPGSIEGVVELEPQHDPRTSVVQVMGTNNFANVDTAGRFVLYNLASGRYTLRVVTTAMDYTPLYTSFRLAPEAEGVLPDTLRPVYTGIPVVTGMKGEYDSASATVRLSWHPVGYRFLSEYLVFRDISPVLSPAKVWLGVATDTVFLDDLVGGRAGLFDETGPDSITLEYRIRVLSKTDSIGLAFGKVALTVTHPKLIRTTLSMSVLGGKGDSSRAGDTIRIRTSFSNPTRKIARLDWYADTSGSVIRSNPFSDGTGADTLSYSWKEPSRPWIYALEVDDAGGQRMDSLRINIVPDAPVANAGNDTSVSINGALRLTPSAEIRFGSIVKWEWDAGNTGNFLEVKDTTINLPADPDTNFLCILRLTSDLGQTAVDTLRIRVVPWTRLEDAPFNGVSSFGYGNVGLSHAVVDGKLYVFREFAEGAETSVRAFEFDPETGRWTGKSKAPDIGVSVRMYLMREIDGIIYLPNPENLFAYDPRTDQWSVKSPPPTARTYNREIGIPSAVVDGKLYLIGGNTLGGIEGRSTKNLDAYDPVTDTWKAAAALPMPDFGTPSASSVYGFCPVGKRLFFYYNLASVRGVDRVYSFEYDPLGDTWIPGDSSLSATQGIPSLDGILNGRIYASKGKYVYDLEAGIWSRSNTLQAGFGFFHQMTVDEDRLFLWVNQARVPGTNLERPQGPWRTIVSSYEPATAIWTSFIPMEASVQGSSIIHIGDRVFMLTQDWDSPMQTFEYFFR